MGESERGHHHSSSSKFHVLAISYPSQGHVNPMYQFCKYLSSNGQGSITTTLAITKFISNTFKPKPNPLVEFDMISDGFDDEGFAGAKSIHEYLIKVESFGSKSLANLITKHRKSSRCPIDLIVYDAFMPWALDVAKEFGLMGAPFFTQPCAVNFIYYYVNQGLINLPISNYDDSKLISIPGIPLLEPRDMPSFIYVDGSYPDYFHMLLNQFHNIHKADFILINTVYEFEAQVVDEMSKILPSFTIGPTIPSFYLDDHNNTNENNKEYGLDLFPTNEKSSSSTMNWLQNKPKSSVVYISFGSMANLSPTQMDQLSLAFLETNYPFIWVVRESEGHKIPKQFLENLMPEKGLVVPWISQVEVLSNVAIGCFFTHCGWNSTLEGLCLGVPMVGMPQWTDQPTNAKYVEDVWKVGVRVKVGHDGVVWKDEIKACIETIMEGEKGREFKENALKWKDIALKAFNEGGSSKKNIDRLICNVRKKIFH